MLNIKKSITVLLFLILLSGLICGCFEADRIATENPIDNSHLPTQLFTSHEINRFIKKGEIRDYVVDQYGKAVPDCSVDKDGNICLNGRLIVKSADALYYALPETILLNRTEYQISVGQTFVPKATFFPTDTSCLDIGVDVIGSDYTINDLGEISFNAAGTFLCHIYSIAKPELKEICKVMVYNQPEDIPKNDSAFKSYGENYAGDFMGLDKSIYMNWLEEHQDDTYYLSTPYDGNDAKIPNGDIPEGKVSGMNCTGFLWHVLQKTVSVSGGKLDTIPGMTGWVRFYKQNNLIRYSFPTKEDMLASGKLSKGDIIWIWDVNGESGKSHFHHVGIYWGDGESDIFWHSLNGKQQGFPTDGNMISHIGSLAEPFLYVVIDMFP